MSGAQSSGFFDSFDSIETHKLDDGTPVVIRPIRPDDRGELLRCFARLGPRSRYQRFLVAKAELSEETLTYLTQVDGKDHVALVAVTDSPDMKRDVGLGVARFVRLPGEDGVAEAAVTVIDEAQGKGLGKLLVAAITKEARRRGIHTFRAEVLASNAAMRHILSEASAVVTYDDGETLVLDVPLGGDDEGRDAPVRRVLRALVTWFASLATLGDDGPEPRRD